MKIFRGRKSSQNNDSGYVALEFSVAMGLLVLPTILILLQIPGLLERSNRADGIAAMVSHQCANYADSYLDGKEIARKTVESEFKTSSVMNQVRLLDADCVFEDSVVSPGSKVTGIIRVEMPAGVVPGTDIGPPWQMTKTHVSIVPKYRSYSR